MFSHRIACRGVVGEGAYLVEMAQQSDSNAKAPCQLRGEEESHRTSPPPTRMLNTGVRYFTASRHQRHAGDEGERRRCATPSRRRHPRQRRACGWPGGSGSGCDTARLRPYGFKRPARLAHTSERVNCTVQRRRQRRRQRRKAHAAGA